MAIVMALATATLTLIDAHSVALGSREVRVRDVAVGGAGDPAAVIVRLPAGARTATLSRRAVASLLRRALPGASVADHTPDRSFAFRIAAGAEPLRVIVRYAPPLPAVRYGEPLTLRSRIGPVTVEREVVALQDGMAGHRVFVRDREGHVSSLQLASATR